MYRRIIKIIGNKFIFVNQIIFQKINKRMFQVISFYIIFVKNIVNFKYLFSFPNFLLDNDFDYKIEKKMVSIYYIHDKPFTFIFRPIRLRLSNYLGLSFI